MAADHAHDHADHDHDHGPDSSPTRIVATATLNSAFAVFQVFAGLVLGSVAILADAAHQAVDALGLVTAAVAIVLLRRPVSDEMSFGWGKADAFGALLSGLLLVASTVWIVIESVNRFVTPVEVSGLGVLAVGVAGAAVNGGSLLLVGGHSEHLSLKAARLHLITDLAGSLLVVFAGAIVAVSGWDRADPAASLLLSALVLHATWRLLSSATRVLLDKMPSDVDAGAVDAALRSLPEVTEVHHLHIRALGGGEVSLTAHVVVDGDLTVHDAQHRVEQMIDQLTGHRISHTTLQIECHPCERPEH